MGKFTNPHAARDLRTIPAPREMPRRAPRGGILPAQGISREMWPVSGTARRFFCKFTHPEHRAISL